MTPFEYGRTQAEFRCDAAGELRVKVARPPKRRLAPDEKLVESYNYLPPAKSPLRWVKLTWPVENDN